MPNNTALNPLKLELVDDINDATIKEYIDSLPNNVLNEVALTLDADGNPLLIKLLTSQLSAELKISLLKQLSADTIDAILIKQKTTKAKYSALMNAFVSINDIEDKVLYTLVQGASPAGLLQAAKMTGSGGTTLFHIILANSKIKFAADAIMQKLTKSTIRILAYVKNSLGESPLDYIVEALFDPKTLPTIIISFIRYLNKHTLHNLFQLILINCAKSVNPDATLFKIRADHPDFFHALIQKIPELAHSRFLPLFCENILSSQFLVAHYPYLLRKLPAQEPTGWVVLDSPINWLVSNTFYNTSLHQTLIISDQKNHLDARFFLSLFDHLHDVLPAIVLEYLGVQFIFNVTMKSFLVAISPKIDSTTVVIEPYDNYFSSTNTAENNEDRLIPRDLNAKPLQSITSHSLFANKPANQPLI